MARVMTEAPRAIEAQRHTVPSHVSDAVEQSLEKLPADRFASCAEFAAALREPTVTAARRTVGGHGESRRPRRIVAALTVLAILLAAAAIWGSNTHQASSQFF